MPSAIAGRASLFGSNAYGPVQLTGTSFAGDDKLLLAMSEFVGRDWFEFSRPRRQSSWKVHIIFEHLARAKSLVPERSRIRGNSRHLSKGIFEIDICEFESSRPSQRTSY
jgi:hypothetical protein